MNRAVLALSGETQSIAVAVFPNLRKNKRPDRQLSLRLNIDGLEKDRTVGKWIPTLTVCLYFCFGRDPINGRPYRRCEKTDLKKKNGKDAAPKT